MSEYFFSHQKCNVEMLSKLATCLSQQALWVHMLLTCVARLTGALIAIDLVNTGPKVAGIALAVVNVDFTVDPYKGKQNSFSETKPKKDIVLATVLLAWIYLWCLWGSCRCMRSLGPGRCPRFCTAG